MAHELTIIARNPYNYNPNGATSVTIANIRGSSLTVEVQMPKGTPNTTHTFAAGERQTISLVRSNGVQDIAAKKIKLSTKGTTRYTIAWHTPQKK